jgi:Clp amino terminal domain, pathogenicity island component
VWHRYLGPEHVLLGVLAEGHSRAAQLLWAHGVELEAARAALGRLADQGMVPAPQPSDTDLLGTLGIDLGGGPALHRAGVRRLGGGAGDLAGDPPAPLAGPNDRLIVRAMGHQSIHSRMACLRATGFQKT